jgi:hypothetical protein
MLLLLYVPQPFNVDQCHASIHPPTVCPDVTSLVVYSYGYDNGKSGPVRCALSSYQPPWRAC